MHLGQSQLTGFTQKVTSRIPRGCLLAGLGLAGLLTLAACANNGRPAPVVDLTRQAAPESAAPGGTYVVRPGDTLYKISRANNVEIDNIKRWNNLANPNQLTVGQVLRLSDNGSAPPPVAAGPAVATPLAPIASTAKPEPRPLDNASQNAVPPPPVAKAAEPHPGPAADAGVIKWGWPASGELLQTFNSNTKGIDIAGKSGDPVLAAADGKVMYSGNGVRGLGNLIIINHQDGFITAYAHNRTLLAKSGQEVKRGAKIAEIGQTDTTSPRLHFEIRRQGTPVDPLRYLPQR